MKKINKLLIPILGLSSIASVAIPLTSCGNNVSLSSIEIKTEPTKKDFKVGEAFSSAWLVITAKYSDGTTKDVASGTTGLTTNYDGKTFTDSDKGNDKEVTVSFKENNTTKTVTYKINVAEAMTNIPLLYNSTMGCYLNSDKATPDKVTLKPGVTYKLTIDNIAHKIGLLCIGTSGSDLEDFSYVANSAKHNGTQFTATYNEKLLTWTEDIQSGSFEVCITVASQLDVFIMCFSGM